jgi:hypothetical protein
MAMRFHDERDKRLHPMRYSQIGASSSGKESFVIRRRGTLARRPINRSQRPDVPLQDDGILDDALVITLCYEAHLAMEQMLAAFAEIRGDDAERSDWLRL